MSEGILGRLKKISVKISKSVIRNVCFGGKVLSRFFVGFAGNAGH